MADSAELPDSDAEPEFAGEMEITVRQDAVRNYVLLADGDNTVEDVLVKILGSERAGRAPEPRLFFNDLELQKQKTLADCGIKPGSVLQLKCTPRVLMHTDERRNSGRTSGWCPRLIPLEACFRINQIFRIFSVCLPTEKADTGCADTSSSVRSNPDGEMKIFVQSKYHGSYALEVDSSNTVQDVLITVLPIERLVASPQDKLYFNGHLLKRAKSLADYGIQDGSILHLEYTKYIEIKCKANAIERPNVNSKRKRIILIDQPLAIWEKEHDKVLLGLLVEQSRNGGTKNIYVKKKDSWRDIVAMFNEATGLKYEHKHLYERFNFYTCEYHIVNRIRHHPKFSWDHQRRVVIATDADWNEYIKGDPDARPYRRRAVPYIDLLEIMFADKEES